MIQITDVDGVSFGVVKDYAQTATAVTSISEDMEFVPDQTYLYKNGQDIYLLFNMNDYVVAAQKGTDFNLQAADNVQETLQGHDVLGIWFSRNDGKIPVETEKENGYTITSAEVNAQVTITENLYNDFFGKLVILNDGQNEWSVFVGAKGEYAEDISAKKKDINAMAKSLVLAEKEPEEEKPTGITLGGISTESEDETAETTVETQSAVIEPTIETAETRAEESTEVVETETVESESTVEIESDEIILVEETETEEERVEETTIETEPIEESIELIEETVLETENTTEAAAVEDTSIEAEKETETDTDELDETKSVAEPKEKGISNLNLNNQLQKANAGVLNTSIYSMANIGETVSVEYFNTAKEEIKANPVPDKLSVCADKKYTGEQAVSILKEQVDNGNLDKYFEPRRGCSFEVVHYTVDSAPAYEDYTLYAKLRGVDGENLRYYGIQYAPRTYQIKVSDTEFYCYYEVPNGCKEYALEFTSNFKPEEKGFYLCKK